MYKINMIIPKGLKGSNISPSHRPRLTVVDWLLLLLLSVVLLVVLLTNEDNK